MKWLETIKVQAAAGQESALEHELEAALYSHASVPGHFAIRLFWDTECPQIRGSIVGLSLAESLKAFGLVDHSVWIEMTKIQRGRENGQ
jgi:hypothetical protein